jgi:hypothetical protein
LGKTCGGEYTSRQRLKRLGGSNRPLHRAGRAEIVETIFADASDGHLRFRPLAGHAVLNAVPARCPPTAHITSIAADVADGSKKCQERKSAIEGWKTGMAVKRLRAQATEGLSFDIPRGTFYPCAAKSPSFDRTFLRIDKSGLEVFSLKALQPGVWR